MRLAVEDRAARTVSQGQALHVFRVIQEAVGNCIPHGRVQGTRVSLKLLKQSVLLSIRDNGCGFNQEFAKGDRAWIAQYGPARPQKIGGRLTVFSKINKGIRVVFDLQKESSDVHR